MTKTYKALALCALAALPLGVVTAGQVIGNQNEVKSEEAETKTVKLTITGMK
ncbi:MAG: hypothetical protein QNL01_03325 [Akkermansiaceae bacterium]|jgi:hypothetical protein|tara:strand:- start:32702 stop:32857 length:156 start_codon:yes stop_codon:yes gene_type:complete